MDMNLHYSPFKFYYLGLYHVFTYNVTTHMVNDTNDIDAYQRRSAWANNTEGS